MIYEITLKTKTPTDRKFENLKNNFHYFLKNKSLT